MRIYFIRHGETTGDVEDRYGGAYDDELSQAGHEQSETMAAILAKSGIESLYVSPLKRAQETAGYIARATNAEIVTVAGLRERNQYGILTGVAKTVARETRPDLVEALGDRMNTIEGAESYEDFSSRIETAVEAILAQAQRESRRKIGIVWHGGPMRVLFRDVLKWGELSKIGDCSTVELDYQESVWRFVDAAGIAFDFDTKKYV